MNQQLKDSFAKLKLVLEATPLQKRFFGFDPFDGLNSPLIKNTFLGKFRLLRLAWVQLFKRSPINFRPFVGIEKSENPQALAIFLSSYCVLYKTDQSQKYLDTINYLANRIIALKITGWSGACWSYPFAWQARAFYQPENTPLIIPTAYCFNALLDAYEITQNKTYQSTALSSAEFVINDLNRSDKGNTFAFSYSPKDTSVVYNASLMASQVLSRSFKNTGIEAYKNAALASVSYCISQQNSDGSWTYGEKSFHQWIDSFHSGYNITCLIDYTNYCNDNQFESHINKALAYYLNSFFEESGFSRYYLHQKYPLDINNSAQLIITLDKAKKLNPHQELVDKVISYTIYNLQSKRGWFYYQKSKWFTNRIIYLRWSNSWMFYAFSLLSKDAKS